MIFAFTERPLSAKDLLTPMTDSPSGPELPISQECEAPVVEEFIYDGHTISVFRQHCIDKMGPDAEGYTEFYYDFEVFEFSLGTTMLRGRAYADTPEEAHLLGMQVDGENRVPLQSRTSRASFRERPSTTSATAARPGSIGSILPTI